MQSRDFCFWLQGYFEIAGETALSKEQVKMIQQHLALVFVHEIDPSIPDPTGELQKIHDGDKKPRTVRVTRAEDVRYAC